MIVANPSCLILKGNYKLGLSKYYPLMSDDLDKYNHIRERHQQENTYLCGMKITYTHIFNFNTDNKTEDIITCPECKIAYRALSR